MQANQIDQTTETEDQNDIELAIYTKEAEIQMSAFGLALQMASIMENYFDGFLTNEVLAQRCIEEVTKYQTEIAEISYKWFRTETAERDEG